MECETYTLAPPVVVSKARKLAETGLYAQALELLQRNCVEAKVYPTCVEMSVPRLRKNPGCFKKGNTTGKRKAQLGETSI